MIFLIGDVLSEDAILKWYKEGHSTKGKSTFLEQMKKFIEWLEQAEEGKLTERNAKGTGKDLWISLS